MFPGKLVTAKKPVVVSSSNALISGVAQVGKAVPGVSMSYAYSCLESIIILMFM